MKSHKIVKNAQKSLKNGSKKIGRPSLINQTTLSKLKSAFILGATDEMACQYAKISPATFYRNQQENPLFQDEIKSYKLLLRHKAVDLVRRKIVKDKDIETAKWYLERKYPYEFGTKTTGIVQIDNRSQTNYIEFTEAEVKEE